MPYEFDDAIAHADLGGGRYAARVHDGWDIRGNANGGYLSALVGHAMRAASGRRDPIALAITFLSPAAPSEVEIATQVVKRGRSYATVSAAMTAGGREIVRALGTFGEAPEEPEAAWLSTAPPELGEYEASPRRAPGSEGFPMPLMERVVVRIHPDDVGFVKRRPTGTALVRGWFAFRDGREVDTMALLLACDVFPPTVFNLPGASGWVPTIQLTSYVRAVPAPGPLRCTFRSHAVQGGTFEEDGEVWDSRGVLVAQSRQLALSPSRNASS